MRRISFRKKDQQVKKGVGPVTKLLGWQVRELTGIRRDQLDYGVSRGYLEAAPETFRHMHLFTLDHTARIALATPFLRVYRVKVAWDLAAEAMAQASVRDAARAFVARKLLGSSDQLVEDPIVAGWIQTRIQAGFQQLIWKVGA